jgi:uncharacterized protein DUF4365
VQVLASAAGFMTAKPLPDVAGVDLVILGTSGFLRGVPLATIQVKSWSSQHRNDHGWHYRDLTEDQFNVLAGKRSVPAFLVLVVVPPDARDYVHARRERLELCHAAYWKSFADKPRMENPSSRRKIPVFDIPFRNLLTVDTLIHLCSGTDSGHGDDTSRLASGL